MLPGTESEDILDAVEALLRDSGFFLPPNSVEIMDGADEGIFAWITVNFLLGRLGRSEKLPTVAIMDLGGGSTQIVFEPKSVNFFFFFSTFFLFIFFFFVVSNLFL